MTLRGSELYMSPSLYERHKFNRKDAFHNAFKSDVFSLGYCFLFAMSLDMEILEQARKYWGKNDGHENIEIDIKKYNGDNLYSNAFIDFIGTMILENEIQRADFLELRNDLDLFD